MKSAGVITDLERWGPANRVAPSLAESLAYCRDLATSHYENFSVASWLLPKRLRQPMFNVYAFCRWADDLGDETGDPVRSIELLQWWRSELERCVQGEAVHPVYVALKETIRDFQLPAQPFHDLITAFEQDQKQTEYESFEDLLGYCRNSADPVGCIVLALFGAATPRNIAWSDSICSGLQLANFWQDVARDLDKGRIYLPREDRLRFGYSDDDLRTRRTTQQFLDLMKFEVDRARVMLLAGRELVNSVPGKLKLDVSLFLRGGLQILSEIERIGYRVWETRPVVSKAAKARLLIASLFGRPIR
jgi:squalene synthase HpnC